MAVPDMGEKYRKAIRESIGRAPLHRQADVCAGNLSWFPGLRITVLEGAAGSSWPTPAGRQHHPNIVTPLGANGSYIESRPSASDSSRSRELLRKLALSDQVPTSVADFGYCFGFAHASALETPGGGVKRI